MKKIFLLILIAYSFSAFAGEYEINKIIASYSLEDGLYEITNKKKKETLYLYKQGSNVILHSDQKILINSQCKMKGEIDDNLY